MREYRTYAFEASYTNKHGFRITKHFASEASMEKWLGKHAVSIYAKGPTGAIAVRRRELLG